MTRFLQSDENPAGYKLEEMLMVLRADILKRSIKLIHDERPAAQRVMANNVKILQHLTEAAALAADSTAALEHAFTPTAVPMDDKAHINAA